MVTFFGKTATVKTFCSRTINTLKLILCHQNNENGITDSFKTYILFAAK